jgi:hypothetical protein|tara:strand:+ start:4104 stop:5354 length:1251 start_codon:yes stop_codon:yes gene_type:complete
MLSFKTYLAEEVNAHMQHIQNLILYKGVKGTRQAIESLRDLRDTLAGSATTKIDVTMKWDGAPAIFFGQVPKGEEDAGKFFVAKKGIFAKTPKYYTTNAEIDADISSPDLNLKMRIALAELPKLKPKGIFQGDMMYSADDLKKQNIEGNSYITFHPNTILYAVPSDSKLAKKISGSKMGIVLHTEYKGDTFDSLSASFKIDARQFTQTKSVWFDDANVKDLSGSASMTKKETAIVTKKLSDAGKLFRKVSSSTLKQIETIPNLAQTIETYANSFVRVGATSLDPKKHVEGLIVYINNKYQKEIDKLKSEKGKDRKIAARDDFMKFFSESNKKQLIDLFTLQNLLSEVKLIIIGKLNQINNMDTFLKTRTGFEVTGHEGFVAIDHLKGNAFKLVDQLSFSHANFSDDILKGWDSPTR